MKNQTVSTEELNCWNCGASLKAVPRPISRHEQCPGCFEALHCCRLCSHYGTDITGQCDEDRADPPVVKENANFCDWFRPTAGAFRGQRTDRRKAAESQLSALFGADPSGSEDDPENSDADDARTDSARSKESTARARLDQLFGDD